MNMKKLIAGIFACMLMFTMCLTGCGNNEEAKDKDKDNQQQQNQDENNKDDNNEQKLQLKVGTNAEFPPFEYMNDNGEIDGFDMALMKEIAKRLNAEITIESMQFNGLIGAISSGQINCIAAGYTIDEERKLACDFSDPYINSEQVVIVRKGTEGIASMDDLKGKTIAVQEGTTGDIIASEDVENSKVSRFKKYLDAVTELKNGKADAVIIDSKPAEVFVNANQDTIEIINELVLKDEEYGIAVKKGDTELLNKINNSIKEIKADGTFDKLVDQYIKGYTAD